MQRFVEAHNRRGELAEALGFCLGGGRGKILFQLCDGPVTLGQLAKANGVDAPYATLIVDTTPSGVLSSSVSTKARPLRR
jgi:hypothetical protein